MLFSLFSPNKINCSSQFLLILAPLSPTLFLIFSLNSLIKSQRQVFILLEVKAEQNCSKLILHCPQCISIKLFLHSIHQLIKLRNRVNFPNSTLFLEWWQQFCFLHHLEKHDYLKFSLDQSQKGPKLICWILTLQFLGTKTRLESGSAWKVWIQCFVCHILVW